MRVSVRLTPGPLSPMPEYSYSPGSGAGIVFEGIVRPTEDGRQILGLEYEVYRPMAERQLELIGREMVEKHGLISMEIEHSTGLVPNVACSFRLRVEAVHRKEGLRAVDEFIDRLKRDVPIWKRAKPSG